MQPLTIGRIAQAAGVGVETVRFYERKGLLEKPARKSSGYRQYGEDAVARLRFIKHAKELGFTLREISELIKLWRRRDATCDELRAFVDDKLTQFEQKIEALQMTRRALRKLAEACTGHRPLRECAILEAFDSK